MIEAISDPWPWYVAGPLIGLVVPALLLLMGKPFGISSSFRDICAATAPGRLDYLKYDWKSERWRLVFAVGIVAGGFLAWNVLAPADPAVAISAATSADLAALGITNQTGLVPPQLMSWHALTTVPGSITVLVGGFLVGFGARWAGGCTSGHAIMGLASRQYVSLIAVLGFFAGGLVSVHFLLPALLEALR